MVSELASLASDWRRVETVAASTTEISNCESRMGLDEEFHCLVEAIAPYATDDECQVCFSHLSKLTASILETQRIAGGRRGAEDLNPLLSLMCSAVDAAKRYSQPPASPSSTNSGLLMATASGAKTIASEPSFGPLLAYRLQYLNSLGQAIGRARQGLCGRGTEGSSDAQDGRHSPQLLLRAVMLRSCLSVAFWSLWALGMSS